MGISGVSGGSSTQLAAMRHKLVERMQKDMDQDGDGAITRSEMKQAFEARAADRPGAPKGPENLDALFAASDTDGNGALSTEELTQLADSMKPPEGPPPAGAQGPPGPPPAGAKGSPRTDEVVSATTSGDASSGTDHAADADGDGEVTSIERAQYDYKQLLARLKALSADA